ncbi:MAG: type II secretion system F family protein [Gemmataceae bacterium]|nr:type II secretion system F family protein [Gemmataceae bacterium]
MEPLLVIGGLVFLAATTAVVALSLTVAEKIKPVESRLEGLVGTGPLGKDNQVEILKEAYLGKEKKSLVEWFLPKLSSLNSYFEQADCNIPPTTFITISVGLAAVVAIVQMLLQWPVYVLAVAPVLASIPWVWVSMKRGNRLEAFSAQLPEGLELLGRALRSGQSLAAGLQVIAQEMRAPIGGEFTKAYERQKLGISIEEALKEMCVRVPSLDLKFFATSVTIQRQTGGDLAEILDKIGAIVRDRFRIKGQVKALTGEGRMSGATLMALPIVLFIYMRISNPEYLSPLWTTDMGQKMLAAMVGMQIIGGLAIRKIIDIKV